VAALTLAATLGVLLPTPAPEPIRPATTSTQGTSTKGASSQGTLPRGDLPAAPRR